MEAAKKNGNHQWTSRSLCATKRRKLHSFFMAKALQFTHWMAWQVLPGLEQAVHQAFFLARRQAPVFSLWEELELGQVSSLRQEQGQVLRQLQVSFQQV